MSDSQFVIRGAVVECGQPMSGRKAILYRRCGQTTTKSDGTYEFEISAIHQDQNFAIGIDTEFRGPMRPTLRGPAPAAYIYEGHLVSAVYFEEMERACPERARQYQPLYLGTNS